MQRWRPCITGVLLKLLVPMSLNTFQPCFEEQAAQNHARPLVARPHAPSQFRAPEAPACSHVTALSALLTRATGCSRLLHSYDDVRIEFLLQTQMHLHTVRTACRQFALSFLL